MVYVNSTKRLTIKTYNKLTDKNALLHYKSHHPRQLINNLLYGQFLRLKRNSTLQRDHYCEKTNLSPQLRGRGYPVKVINQANSWAQQRTHHSLLAELYCTDHKKLACGFDFISK